jgi:hypothetical protein
MGVLEELEKRTRELRVGAGAPLAQPSALPAVRMAVERDEILAHVRELDAVRRARAAVLDRRSAGERADFAKLLIGALDRDQALLDRARQLITTPDDVNQHKFGVCGIAGILRHIARTDPVRFAELVEDTLRGPEFVAEWTSAFTSVGGVDKRYLLDFLLSQWLARRGASGYAFQVALAGDLLRGRIKLWTGEDEAAPVGARVHDAFDAQRGFSDLFKNVDQALQNWEARGHFAVTAGGLNYIFGRVCRDQLSLKIKIADFAEDYRNARDVAGPAGTVLASTTDMKRVLGDVGAAMQGRRIPPLPPPLPPGAAATALTPKMDHWIVIQDVTGPVNGNYTITYWSWAKAGIVREIPERWINSDPSKGDRGCFYSFVALRAAKSPPG